jgi:hypothetical protein
MSSLLKGHFKQKDWCEVSKPPDILQIISTEKKSLEDRTNLVYLQSHLMGL